jgi:tetratricopeptide (TPR) repeat protein
MNGFAKFALTLLFPGACCGAAQNHDATQEIASALRQGRAAEAEKLCDEALSAHPDDPRIWTLKGVGLDGLGQRHDALQAYDQALRLAPDYLPALEAAAQDEFLEHSQKAVPLLERADSLRPNDPKIHEMLGELALQRRDCRKAVFYLDRETSALNRGSGTLEGYAACLVYLNHSDRAVLVFQELVEKEPENENARYNLAIVQLAIGQSSEAVKTLGPLTERNQPDADSLSLLAQAYEAVFNTPKAVDTLQRAVALYPDDPEFYVALALICLSHRSFRVGIDVLNAGIARLPREASLHFARGVLYLELDENEKSEKDFDEAAILNPQLPLTSAANALADLQHRQPSEAERLARKELAGNPNDPYLNYVLAESMRQQSLQPGTPRFVQAEAAAKKAVDLKPDFSPARQLLGWLYLDSGHADLALEQSREAVKRAPNDEAAFYQLIRVLKRAGKEDEIPKRIQQLEDLKEANLRKREQVLRFALSDDQSGQPSKH